MKIPLIWRVQLLQRFQKNKFFSNIAENNHDISKKVQQITQVIAKVVDKSTSKYLISTGVIKVHSYIFN